MPVSTEKTQNNSFLSQPTHRRAYELFQPFDIIVLYAALKEAYTQKKTPHLVSLGRHIQEVLPTMDNSERIMVISDVIRLIGRLL